MKRQRHSLEQVVRKLRQGEPTIGLWDCAQREEGNWPVAPPVSRLRYA